MKGLFVTGTDTEIGKTYVSTGMVRTLVERGYKVAGMKPVGTGGKTGVNLGRIVNDDVEALMTASNSRLLRDDINQYSYLPATSPHIAASEANDFIDLNKICATYRKIEDLSDYVVVEGVGGWLVPLNETETVENLALALGLPPTPARARRRPRRPRARPSKAAKTAMGGLRCPMRSLYTRANP